ncbi:MAG: HEPN domain-containing protein [Candidatus Brockarchaeota archaeon]|nr:HEPN domain-containing protein [Candidatus Brockarchaeota archaeon]
MKSKRKLKRAREAFNGGDYDSALGDTYRCVELIMRALLIARGVTRLPKIHGGLLQLFA